MMKLDIFPKSVWFVAGLLVMAGSVAAAFAFHHFTRRPFNDFHSSVDIRSVGENAYEITSKDPLVDSLHAKHASHSEAAMQARIVPAFKDGKAQGFKLFSIREGSLYDKLGFQNGDVIQRVNGISLDTPEKALETYALLKTARRLEVDLHRDGAPLRKVYDVK
ncbi:hypothetical protein HUW62_09200 [Myxococcus sp. AM011]|uniref:hypothetical protein n=1 Tax=Myxococcus sp. AM011 TaxID=2745200 RepID=UPI001594EF1F|nr:hypothetical protein [Myxococcus sp. AM011]NVJ21393.1 hypothetical protein [Myxococcus sp. AM011]